VSKLNRTIILDVGLILARAGLSNVTAGRIAIALGVTRPAISYYFYNTNELRNAVASYAVRQRESTVIAQLILSGHAAVNDLSSRVRSRHLAAAANS